MATIVPTDWRTLEATGAAAREIETLAVLEAGLPDELTVLHGVHWTRIEKGYSAFGEIDFVVVTPSARIVLIEQKSGFLKETPEGLIKNYQGREKRVSLQLDRTLDALRSRLAPVVQNDPLALDYFLYCPDYTVKEPGSAGVPAERIIDARRRGELCTRLLASLPREAARDTLAHKLRRFFENELQLVPDVNALLGHAERLVTRLSEGLATWARRLEFDPFRLRVIGTAGSGKTQLALAVLNDAAAAGRRALYVCFNRPLADHLARVAPEGVEVATFHQLCDRRLRAAGQRIDYSVPGAFDETSSRFAALAPPDEDRVDELIVDEGQDFHAPWLAPLMARLRPDGRAWWLEDPMQNLYGRDAVPLPGWTTLRDDTNYRSPRDVIGYVNRLLSPERAIVAASPIAGADVEFLAYADTAALIDRTKRAVTLGLQAGFRKQDIAVVTFSGRERSKLVPFDTLGAHRLVSFTGRYDLFGNPQYSEGDLLIETVYRFKGQAAPCVILTEVDFEAVDDIVRRKLFVGMTRASMRLIVVLSEKAAALLLARSDGPGRAGANGAEQKPGRQT
jgi:hypothetical protein